MTGVDIVGEAVPNWIAAVSALGALGAAVAAGIYAARAAKATREQANAAGEDVALARRALEVAESEARAAREETERATRWAEERRLDGLAPSVFMEAVPDSGNPALGFSLERKIAHDRWVTLDAPESFDFEDHRGVSFRQTVKIKLSNLSDLPARIDFIQPDGGVLETKEGVPLSGGGPVWVLPHDDDLVVWRRQVGAPELVEEAEARADGVFFRVEAWVRDSGMNVCDLYRFHGNITDVSVRGFVATVFGVPPERWLDRVAYPVDREYTRLDAADAASAAGPV